MALRIGIAGLGTVGQALVQLIEKANGQLGVTGEAVAIAGVTASRRDRAREIDVTRYKWFDDAAAMASAAEMDCIVELIGGTDGVARATVEAALDAGKPVVTANKALLATHADDLCLRAERASVPLRYEAAVAGGTPVVEGVRNGAAAVRIDRVAGILNGTCNFILSEMARGRSFDRALSAAQTQGFAEADPSVDVDGHDAAHKLALLATLAFGARVPLSAIDTRGIGGLSAADMAGAAVFGARIKLLASAIRQNERLALFVGPVLVPEQHPFAAAEGAGNAISVSGDPLGTVLFAGPGAGGGATASAVAADIVAVAKGWSGPVFARPAAETGVAAIMPPEERTQRHYLRLPLAPGKNRAGPDLMAAIEGRGVPVASFDVRPEPDDSIHLHLSTRRCRAGTVDALPAALDGHDALAGPVRILPFLDPDA